MAKMKMTSMIALVVAGVVGGYLLYTYVIKTPTAARPGACPTCTGYAWPTPVIWPLTHGQATGRPWPYVPIGANNNGPWGPDWMERQVSQY